MTYVRVLYMYKKKNEKKKKREKIMLNKNE